jgi:hypothetical protein
VGHLGIDFERDGWDFSFVFTCSLSSSLILKIFLKEEGLPCFLHWNFASFLILCFFVDLVLKVIFWLSLSLISSPLLTLAGLNSLARFGIWSQQPSQRQT